MHPECTWYVYLLVFINPRTGVQSAEAWAQPWPDNTNRCTLLFEVPEKWIPKSAYELKLACTYHKVPFEMGSVEWYGDVCF